MKLLVLDAGHGGVDPGSKAEYDGAVFFEKNLTYMLAEAILDLVKPGLKTMQVLIVPRDETTCYPNPDRFKNRVAWAAKAGATHFISLHMNHSEISSTNGVEAWYADGDEQGHAWALKLVEATAKAFQTPYRGANSDKALTPPTEENEVRLGILQGHKPTTKAALLEVGYMTNSFDFTRVRTPYWRDEWAREILNYLLLED